jgi:hypothetical protein
MNISIFVCDITLCYYSITYTICVSQNTTTVMKRDYVSIKGKYFDLRYLIFKFTTHIEEYCVPRCVCFFFFRISSQHVALSTQTLFSKRSCVLTDTNIIYLCITHT